MSSKTHLPPRCPSNGKSPDTALCNQHLKSIPRSSELEHQPARLNTLLTDSGKFSQKSAIDSVAVSYGLVSSQTLSSDNDHESLACIGTVAGLESTCSYGPNPPKSKDRLVSEETAVMSKLSEYLSLYPLQHSDDGLLIPGMLQCDSVHDTTISPGEASSETVRRRHNREGSRCRKLHYIAELERMVDDLQKLQSDLALRIVSSLQQQAVLSIENSNLKQQIAKVEQDKSIADGQYQSLKQEENWLKVMLGFSTRDSWSSSGDKEISLEEAVWKLPDMCKLNIS